MRKLHSLSLWSHETVAWEPVCYSLLPLYCCSSVRNIVGEVFVLGP